MSSQSEVITFYVEDSHSKDIDFFVDKLETDIDHGLSSEEVNRRQSIVGPNKIITPQPSIWQVYLAPLFDTLISTYLVMTAVMVVLSFIVEGIISKVAFWLVMISFNFIMAIVQQYRAQKKVSALSQLSPPQAKVIRDGKIMEVKAEDLVPGDIIELSLGDRIPADARLISSSNLTINEASLTGESVAVRKDTDGHMGIDKSTPIAKHSNMVYLGTFVQSGSGNALIISTGNNTVLGQIATQMSDMTAEIEIPLKKRVNSLGKGLVILMLTFLVTLILSTSIRRIQSNQVFTFERFAFDLAQAIINAMSVMPINIPLLTTVVLITGVLHMSTKKVVIKELSVVETLGRTSVLCSDKTGTITTGKMTVKLLWDTNDYYQVWLQEDFSNKIVKIGTNNILENVDELPDDYEDVDNITPNSSLELLMTGAISNNDANITPVKNSDGTVEYKIIGNFTDGALLVLAKTNGLDVDRIRQRYKQVKSYPFDSSLKRMSGLFEDTVEDDHMIFCKGATEVILPRCTKIGDENDQKTLTEEMKTDIVTKVQKFADEGYRVISLAYKEVNELSNIEDQEKERDEAESDLVYIGFSIIYDPPRPRVKQAVADLDSAGIFPIMITGDSHSTAGTIARQVGILDPDEMVIEGHKAAELDDTQFFKVSVFARVSPKDKEVIVNRYQERGDVVAMTGDGVNDALAITRSDAGVAMGVTGTEVAKEAADIILTDDSYVSLVEGVREGRNLYNRIRMMIFFYIAVNLAEAIMYFTTSFRLDFFIFNDWQRAYIFGIVHALPVLAIIFGPDDKEVMTLKPRQDDALLTRNLIYLLVIFAVSAGIIFLTIYFMIFNSPGFVNGINNGGITDLITFGTVEGNISSNLNPKNLAQAKARTMTLTVIYLIETLFVLSIYRVNRPVWETVRSGDINLFIIVMIISPLIMHFSFMYTPLQKLFHNTGVKFELIPLSPLDLLITFIFASIPLLLLEGYKYYEREIRGNQF